MFIDDAEVVVALDAKRFAAFMFLVALILFSGFGYLFPLQLFDPTKVVYAQSALVPNIIYSESNSLIDWSYNFTSSHSYDDIGYSILQVSDFEYIICGVWRSQDQSEGDAFLLKLDSNGNVIWQQTYGGTKAEEAYSVQQTNDGGYILTGYTNSFGEGSMDVYLVKTDSEGILEWNRTYGGSSPDWAHSVIQLSGGEYVIAGHTASYGAGNWDYYLIKTDSLGNMIWNRTYGGINLDWAESIQQTNDEGFIIAGYTDSYGEGKYDVFLVKTDSEGNLEWNRTYGGPLYERAESVIRSTEGGYVIVGSTSSFGSGDVDIYLIKTDESGNQVWYNTFGGYSGDSGHSIEQTNDGGYIIVGDTWSYNRSINAGEIILIKTDSDGNKIWNYVFGCSNPRNAEDEGRDVHQTNDGGYIITGHTGGWFYDSNGNRYSSSDDVFISKLHAPKVIIDGVEVTSSRSNVGSIQSISFHASWEHEPVVADGTIYVNGTGYAVNATGWASLSVTSSAVGKKTWTVTGVNCSGVTDYIQTASDPSIIRDHVEVYDSGVTPERVGSLVNSTIWFKARYVYDFTCLNGSSGQIYINGTSCAWSEARERWEMNVSRREAGNVTYVVTDVSEAAYGLTGFTDAAGPVSVFFTGEWSASLSVNVEGSSAGVVLGLDENATKGFDVSAGDALAFPAPPSGVSAYFDYPDNPLSPVDMRKLSTSFLPVEYLAEWALKVRTIGVSGDAILNWSSSEIDAVPVNYSIILNTPYGRVDMRSVSQYSWNADADTLYSFTLYVSSEVEFTMELRAGWNMVSLPVVPDDMSATSVLDGVGFYQLVTWSGTGYATSTEFEAGRGYWLLVLEDTNVTISGTPVEWLNLTLSPGWSMIGGLISNVQAADVFPDFYQLATWTGTGYTPATVFELGKGYWALVLAETQIQLSPT